MYLLGADNQPLSTGVHCYSLQKANDLDPAASDDPPRARRLRPAGGRQRRVRPRPVGGQPRARRGARRRRPGRPAQVRRSARWHAARASRRRSWRSRSTSSPAARCTSTCRSGRTGKPAFAPENGSENPLMLQALGGLIQHLPGIALYGSPTVNSYKRFELDSFAPVNVSWGGDNRTVSIRSLVESPNATRIELRTPASDANPYWAAAGMLTAIAVGYRGRLRPRPARRGLPLRHRRQAADDAGRRHRRRPRRHAHHRAAGPDGRRRPAAAVREGVAGVHDPGLRLGHRPLPRGDLSRLQQRRDELLERHPRGLRGQRRQARLGQARHGIEFEDLRLPVGR